MVRWRLPKPGQNGQEGHGQGADQAVEVRELKEGQTPLLSLKQRSIPPPHGDGQQARATEEGRADDGRGEEKHRRREDPQQHDGMHSPPASKGKRTLCGFKSSASAEPQSARPDPDYEPDAAELFDHVQLHAWASHGMRCPWRGCEYYFRGKSNGYSNLRKHLLTHWKTRSNTICPLCFEGITVNGPMALPRHYASGW
ncbi:hypothetical protein K525DRAFT_194010 [Schizophyllum commune Loenen D]|nr:hypothetical protein K525DRAFT_194010 [Schizophyllum commune Loenen D]